VQDACLSSARVAKELCYAARDALLLYKAIVPVQLEKQLDSINQVAAIIHNDFYHLSQEILGLAFEVCGSYSLLFVIVIDPDVLIFVSILSAVLHTGI
jgi:hypothetical protein